MRTSYLLPLSILITIVVVAVAVVYLIGSQKEAREQVGREAASRGQDVAQIGGASDPLAVGGRDVILGDPEAPVTFLEYGDYQCPFCGELFSRVEPALREQYITPGRVRMVYRNFAFLGSESFAAAEAAECAKDQEKFWAFHDLLFTTEIADGREKNGNLDEELFLSIARELNMNIGDFIECFQGGRFSETVRDETAVGRELGVASTPTTFINERKVEGALSVDAFATIIDEALAESLQSLQ